MGGWLWRAHPDSDHFKVSDSRASLPSTGRAELGSDLGTLLLSQVVHQVGEGVAVFDLQDRIVYANPALADLHHCLPETLLGQSLSAFVSVPEEVLARRPAEAAPGLPVRAELVSRRLDGSLFHANVTVSELRDAAGALVGRIACVRDISDRKELEERLHQAALHDSLTGLPNRRLLADRLSHAMARAERTGMRAAVLFIDLDGFKSVNDAHGHQVGDELLTHVAHRLTTALRQQDTLARVGGDEFVVLLEDVADAGEPAGAAQRLLQALEPPFRLRPAQPVRISASIGICMGPPGSGDDLLLAADAAMYEAKKTGRGWVLTDA